MNITFVKMSAKDKLSTANKGGGELSRHAKELK